MSFVNDYYRVGIRLDVLATGKICTNNKGDLLVDDGVQTGVISVGSNGQMLFANSAATYGIEYRTPVSSDISDFDTEVGNNTNVTTNTTHRGLTNNPHSVTKAQVGLTNVEDLKVKLDATVGPSVSNDSSEGYSVGSRWFDITANIEYVCLDASVGSAVWTETTVAIHNNLVSLQGGTTSEYYHLTSVQHGYINGLGSNATGISDTQTLTNKTLTAPVISSIVNTGTLTLPTSTDTLVGTNTTDTLTNKTLTTPVISTISNTGTLTLPTDTDTLVGKATTDILTNKTWGDTLNMNSNKITNLATPTADSDAANKSYVDATATGLDVKSSVVAAAEVDLDSNASIFGTITYNSTAGTSSRGQITATLNVSDVFTVDGVNFSASENGSRVLLMNQTSGAQNGVWTTTVSGTSLTLDRATDFDQDAEVTSGAFTFVEQGTTYDNSGFVLSTNDPIIIGGASGTVLAFSQFSGAGQITAGSGMTKTDNTLNVVGSSTVIANANDLEVNSSSTENQVLLSSGSVGTACTFGTVPLGNTDSVSGVVGIANGGTNASSFTAGSRILATNSGNTALETTSLDPANLITLTGTQTLTNKTLTSAVLTTPQINDTSEDHQYIFAVSELTLDRTVTLPLLTSNDTFVFQAHTQTLTNKTLTAPVISTISNGGTITLPTGAQTLVGRTTTDTLTNKTITSPVISSIINTGTITLPTSTDTLVGRATTDTLTNKTLTVPIISSISNTGTLTLPTSTDTLVGRATTDTLTNKTITAPIISSIINTGTLTLPTSTDTLVGRVTTDTLTNKTLTAPKIVSAINDTNGNELIKLTSAASAVNEITVQNSIASSGPTISSTGNDTNIDLNITPKGSGNIVLDGLKWMNTDGTANQIVKTDGSGNLGYGNTELLTVGTVSTTDATITTVTTVATADDNYYLVEARVIGIRTDAGPEGAGFVIKAFFRNDAGVLTKVDDDKFRIKETLTWDSNVDVSGTDIVVTVTGVVSSVINWRVEYKMIVVS